MVIVDDFECWVKAVASHGYKKGAWTGCRTEQWGWNRGWGCEEHEGNRPGVASIGQPGNRSHGVKPDHGLLPPGSGATPGKPGGPDREGGGKPSAPAFPTSGCEPKPALDFGRIKRE